MAKKKATARKRITDEELADKINNAPEVLVALCAEVVAKNPDATLADVRHELQGWVELLGDLATAIGDDASLSMSIHLYDD